MKEYYVKNVPINNGLFVIGFQFEHIRNINYSYESHKTQTANKTQKYLTNKPGNNKPITSDFKTPNKTGGNLKDSQNYIKNEIRK